MTKQMKASKACLTLIEKWEGFKNKMYRCPAGLPTIGIGTLIDTKQEEYLMTTTITHDQAVELLKSDLTTFEKAVNSAVLKDLNQNQYDALVCFTYNVGPANLRASTLLKKVNVNPNDATIRDEFMKWNKANGKALKGLTNRRKDEADLYFA